MFWRVVTNYKKILEVVQSVALAANDKVITEAEARGCVDKVLELAKALGLVKS